MPITIRPSLYPDRELDLTKALTAAVAHELWKRCGGNEVVNWIEAERFVASLARTVHQPQRAPRQPGGRAQDHRTTLRPAPRRPDLERVSGPIPYLY